MRFLIDAQLPTALASALREEGHEAWHLEEVGLRHAKDNEVWKYAKLHGAILITKDEDFVEQYHRRKDSPALFWLRIGNASRRALLAWFMSLLPQLLRRLEAGDRFIEVR